jgi:glutathione S-transferase
MEPMQWVTLIILLSLAEYLVFSFFVGYARGRYKVAAPATSGNEVFERHFRVHQNTLEQLVVFIPSIWVFGTHISGIWGAVIGAVFLVGRAIYAVGYVRGPKQREIGFMLSALPMMVLLLGAIYGVIRALILIQRIT